MSDLDNDDPETVAKNARDDLYWDAVAVPNRLPIEFDAKRFDEITGILFRLHTSVFRIATAISEIQLGNIEDSKKSNGDAVRSASESLKELRGMFADVKSTIAEAHDVEGK